MVRLSLAEESNRYIAGGRAAEAEGQLRTTATLIRSALAIRPDEKSLHNWLGWTLYNLGEYQAALTAALQVGRDDAASYLGSLRLKAFIGLEEGAWWDADSAVEEAQAIDGDFSAVLRSELSDRLLSLVTNGAGPLPVVMASLLPDFILDPQNEVGRKVAMTIAARAMTDLDFNTCTAMLAPTSIGARPRHTHLSDRPLAGTAIVTSIAPARLEVQRRAISSWRRYGATVLSVNAPGEVDHLRSVMPEVKFVGLARSAENLFDKPYPYFDDMLQGGPNAGMHTIGLFNADVVLGEGQCDNLTRAVRQSHHALVVGHRLDVDDGLSPEACERATPYLEGFDWFVLDRTLVDGISTTDLVFGCPWWDLWLPVAAMAAGLPVVIDRECRVYHERHATRWAEQTYHILGRRCLENLAALDPSVPLLNLLQSIAASAATSVLRHVDERFMLDWLAGMMRTAIAGQSISVPKSGRR